MENAIFIRDDLKLKSISATAANNKKKISNDTTATKPPSLVTANQVAHQLLANSRGKSYCSKLLNLRTESREA